jgi:D-alanyl-D-alanine-carboxypeptidase/D-alanyl-D-alanine-endopeptidase
MLRAAPLLILALCMAATIPSDAEIRKILVDRIDGLHRGVGIVVGIIGPDGRRVVAYGAPDKAGGRPLDGDTVFEIGSVTKVFTGLLLSDMVRRGEVALDDPVSKYLPATVKVPQRGRPITLVDLATHSSGLPRLPTNLAPKDANNPYADYTVANLYAFLSSYPLPRDAGSGFEYSNLGDGLLGHVLALRAGTDYETLVRTRITDPLGMKSTAITLSPDQQARLAPGHDAQLKRAANWDFPTLPGAGALRSTVNDMLTFLGANLGYVQSPLAPAMKAMLDVSRPAGDADLTIGLGWLTRVSPAPKIVWHNGGTGGYRSWIGFDPAARVGVVVLSNASVPEGVDDIGGHIIDPSIDPLSAADLKPKEHKEVAIDPSLLDRYVGRYQLLPNFILSITRNGNRLFAQATGQGRFEIFPEGEKDFFAKIGDIQITFVVDAAGKAGSIVLHQQGVDAPAKRIE